MTNILFVSCYSVDINNSASIELIYYMNLLSASGKFKVHLLTMDFPSNSIYYDSEISKLVSKDIKIHRIKGGFLLNKLLPKNIKISKEGQKNSKKALLIKMKNLFTVIDPYVSWCFKAVKYFRNQLIDEKFDIILGMHEPPSSLICSYKIKDYLIKKTSKVKFISYFSDPYCNELSRRNKNFITRKINESIESKIVSKSDKFLFVSKDNYEYYKEKYGINSDNVQIIHRGYDIDFYNQSKGVYPKIYSKDKINVLHAGDIALGMRNVCEFIEALDSLKKEDSLKFSKLNINFYGNINDSNQELLLKKKNYISYNSRISYSKIVNYMVNADVLIIFGNKEFKQIPAKIYDYVGINAYILVIVESYKDPLYELVKNTQGVFCVLNNKDSIKKEIIKLLDQYNNQRNFDRNEFSNENILYKLEKIFYD